MTSERHDESAVSVAVAFAKIFLTVLSVVVGVVIPSMHCSAVTNVVVATHAQLANVKDLCPVQYDVPNTGLEQQDQSTKGEIAVSVFASQHILVGSVQKVPLFWKPPAGSGCTK